MANLAEALKQSLPAEETLAPAETPSIESEFEAQGETKPEGKTAETKEKPATVDPKAEDGKAKSPEQVPWRALKDEREKRQKAESELAYLRGRLEGQQPQKKDEPSDDDLDNEFLLAPSATLNRRLENAVDQRIRDYKANLSDAIMRREAEDYPELLGEFAALANANPELWKRAAEEMEPARAIYNFMKARKNPQTPVDEKKLREKIRAEVEEEYTKKRALQEAKDTPPSPAGAPGSGETLAGKLHTIDDLFSARRQRVGR